MSESKQRVAMLDTLRGIAVIGMVFHHALESFKIVFSNDYLKYGEYIHNVNKFLGTEEFRILQLVFVSVFLLVSGICTHYSRSVLKRGAIVFAAAMLMTVATCNVLPRFGIEGLNIYFGILHMFGLSMIIYSLLQFIVKKTAQKCDKIISKIPPSYRFVLSIVLPLIGAVVSVVLFVWYYKFYQTSPTSDSWLLLPFGILPNDMTSYGDYYPLFPFFFMFLAGACLGKLVKDNRFPKWFYSFRVPVIDFIGRKSLWVYILHQPIIFPIMLLIFNLI